MSALTLPAPAKVNLFLHVVGRRPDGYHELQTAFQFVDVCDRITLRLERSGRIGRSNPIAGVPADADLTVRAARRLQAMTGVALGVEIGVVKRIPMGGGLGGGSSDAATTLRGLDALWGLRLGVDALADLGLELGADVPVFVRGRASWAEGIGERLAPLALDRPWYLIVNPGCPVPTPRVFNHPSLTRNTPVTTMRDLVFAASGARSARPEVARLVSVTRNDCEAVARELFPEVGAVVDWLGQFGPARMTGTGAAVFAPFATREAARQAKRSMPRRWTGFVARGLNDSPLAAALDDEVRRVRARSTTGV